MQPGEGAWQGVDLARAAAAAGSGISVADATVRGFPLVYVNPAFERLTGYAAAECLGRGCGFLQCAESEAAAVERMRVALAAGRAVHVVLVNERRDGSLFSNAVRLAPIHDKAGRVMQVVGVQNDVSIVVEREQRLAAERDQALMNLQALLADVLGAEERERQRLARSLHDDSLQYLLTAAQDLLEAEATSADGAEALARARKNLEHAVAHLRGLVGATHPLVLDSSRSLEDELRALTRDPVMGGRQAVTIEVDPAAHGVADDLVLAVARELMINAARHSGAQHVGVNVGRENGSLVMMVRDDGVGVAPERIQAARADGHVGLALSQQRIQAAGGTWELVSSPGAGVDVRVTLPV